MDDNRKTETELREELKNLHHQLAQIKRMQALSREDRLKLAIIERAPFSIWACNRDFEIVFWSSGTSKIYDRAGEEAIGKNYLDLFVSEEERERSASDCLRVIDEDYMQRNFLAYDQVSDGTKRALLTNCFRIWDADKDEYLQAEVALEVPELEPIIEEHRTLRELGIKRKAEYERILLLERLGTITTLISSFILSQEGPKRVFEGIIDIVKDILGGEVASDIYLYDENKHAWSKDSLVGTNDFWGSIKIILGQYFVSDKRALFVDNENDIPVDLPEIIEWWKNSSDHAIAILPLISNGKTVGVWLIAMQKPFVFQEGTRESLRLIANQVAFAVRIARLVQSLKDLNAKIAEKQDLITRSLIAVDFVHRMNNLAGPIRGWKGLIMEELDLASARDQKIRGYLDEIDSEVRGLLKAANNLEKTPMPQEIDINFMLSSMLRNVKIQYPSVITEASLSPDIYLIKAIHSQLSDAIWNVISNALDAMPAGGMLTLKSRNVQSDTGKKWVEITIRDTGSGVPEEHRDRIFDINYTTKEPGRGYGLWRTKHVIEDMGGTIVLSETESKRGTTFAILIPGSLTQEKGEGS